MTRVIAGAARGRRLAVPPGQGTRPTSDRAREGLFSSWESLRGPLHGARVLDLYGGSGAVALEALSRGAAHALIVEADAKAVRVIKENVRTVGLPGAEVRSGKAERIAAGPAPAEPYDVVFLDPPYAVGDQALGEILITLADGGWITDDAVVTVERSTRGGAFAWPEGYRAVRERRYGEGTLWYGRAAVQATPKPLRPESEEHVERRAVCPGSFDPVTNGHLDIIGRASRLYDVVHVAVLINKSKQGMFTVEERMQMIKEVSADYGNIVVESHHGLLVDYCRERGIPAIVKGLRAVSDFDYELQMAQMNNGLTGVETLFVPTSPAYSFLSSSLVKEVATYGGDVSHLVPESVHRRLAARIAERARS